MSTPLVSIICEVFNHEPYIRQCLDGFVSQKTSFPIEVLIHDDASTDRSATIIREYEKIYPGLFKPIYQSENQYSKGVNIWCDIQFARAKGKYIAICEGDDYWTDPLKIQKQVDFMEGHPDYTLCCTAFTQTENGDEQHPAEIAFGYDDITLEDILKGAWIGTLTTLFRNDAIADYQVPLPDLPMGDLPLWCHLAMKGKVKYLHDATANYRRLQNSACHPTDAEKEYRFRVDAMRVRDYYAKLAGESTLIQPLYNKESHYILNQCFKNQWIDFPLDSLWAFIQEYGHPSGYDRLRRWGLRSNLSHAIAKAIMMILNKN